MSQARPPASILRQPGNAVNDIYRGTQRLARLQRILDRYLASFQASAQVAAFDRNILTLNLPDAPVATRLRYATPKLVRSLRNHTEFQGLKGLSIHVRPVPERPAPEPAERPPISAETAHHIELTAKYIEDRTLRKALESLADSAKRDLPEN